MEIVELKVYVLRYEGQTDSILGVYDSMEKLEEARQKDATRYDMGPAAVDYKIITVELNAYIP